MPQPSFLSHCHCNSTLIMVSRSCNLNIYLVPNGSPPAHLHFDLHANRQQVRVINMERNQRHSSKAEMKVWGSSRAIMQSNGGHVGIEVTHANHQKTRAQIGHTLWLRWLVVSKSKTGVGSLDLCHLDCNSRLLSRHSQGYVMRMLKKFV